jgi:hypothetical protein
MSDLVYSRFRNTKLVCSEQLDESVDSMVKAQLEMALPQVIHEKFEQQMGTLIAEKAITQEQLTYALAPAINDIRNLFGASTRQDATFASLTLVLDNCFPHMPTYASLHHASVFPLLCASAPDSSTAPPPGQHPLYPHSINLATELTTTTVHQSPTQPPTNIEIGLEIQHL